MASSEPNQAEFDVVTLMVENEGLRVSKRNLSEKSDYFKSMFSLPVKESNQREIILHDVSLDLFKFILEFECLSNVDRKWELLAGKDVVDLVDILFEAHRFQFHDFSRLAKKQISFRLNGYYSLDARNSCELLSRRDILEILELSYLVNKIFKYIDSHAEEILWSQCLLELSVDLVGDILKRDTFLAPERFILALVVEYINRNSKADAIPLLNCVRFRNIQEKDVRRIMRYSRRPIDMTQYMDKPCNPRICTKEEEDLNEWPYTNGFSCEIIEELSSGESESVDVKDVKYKVLTLPFQIPVRINTVKFVLRELDRSQPTCMFILEVRVGNVWKRLKRLQTSHEYCDVVMEARFEPLVVNAIRLEVHPASFNVKEFHCLYSKEEKDVGFYHKIRSVLDYGEYRYPDDSNDEN